MNMQLNSGARVRRDAKIGRWLKLIIAAVLFAGLFMQITMLSRISAQNKKASLLEKEIGYYPTTTLEEGLRKSINTVRRSRGLPEV